MFGERLKLARKRRGLSLRALSSQIGGTVSAQAIGKYERGEMGPSSVVVIALANALDISADYLLSSSSVTLEAVAFRKLASTKAKERATVEAEVLDHVDRYLQVEEFLGMDTSFQEQPAGAPYAVNRVEDADSAAESVRISWDLGSDPIQDMTHLLEDHGIKVFKLEFPLSVDGLTCDVRRTNGENVPVIVYSTAKSPERQRFTLAHELGHAVLDISDELHDEKVCNRFAGAFLVPSDQLTREVGLRRANFGFNELIEIKHFFGISAASLVLRLRDLEIIRQSTANSIFRGIGRTWRKDEPRPLQRQEIPLRFRRLCLRALAEDAISITKAAELLRMQTNEIEGFMLGDAVQ